MVLPQIKSCVLIKGKQDTLAKVQELMTNFNIQIDNLWYQPQFVYVDIVNFSLKIASRRLLNSLPFNSSTKLNAPSVETKWLLIGNVSAPSVEKNANSKLYLPKPKPVLQFP